VMSRAGPRQCPSDPGDYADCGWRDPRALRRDPLLARLLDRGTGPELLATAIRHVVLDTVGSVISVISVFDEGSITLRPPDTPGWALMATRDGRSGMTLTGRDVGGLHESLLQADPQHTEDADFR
jgi:hypothetical protein